MFKAGDTVSYGTSGVCTIAEQKRVTLGGKLHDCFILKPVYDASMKICVPCDSAPLFGRMRPLPTRTTCWPCCGNRCPTTTRTPTPASWPIARALKSGNLHALVRMVRDIRTEQSLRRAKGKQLSAYEDSALRDAQNVLHSEFAYVMGIEPNEVPKFIAKN